MTPRDRPNFDDLKGVPTGEAAPIACERLLADLDLAHKRIEELEAEIKSRRQSWGTVHFRPDGSFRVDQEER